MDKLDAQGRSANMRQIRSRDTKPEMLLRSLLHKEGYRFRLHRNDLPGKPDIVFPGRRKVVFVHGCFWHQHSGCREGRIPGSRREYWEPKLARNLQRDSAAQLNLREQGWQSIVVWECELKSQDAAIERVKQFLGPSRRVSSHGNIL